MATCIMSMKDSGEVILFVHGNPTWSFMYRHLIKGLSAGFPYGLNGTASRVSLCRFCGA